jgi:hypothetical protein
MDRGLMAIVPPHDPQNSGSPSWNRRAGRPFLVIARVNCPTGMNAAADLGVKAAADPGLSAPAVERLLASWPETGGPETNAGSSAIDTSVISTAPAVWAGRRSGSVIGCLIGLATCSVTSRRLVGGDASLSDQM